MLWDTPLHPQRGQIPHRPNRNQAHIFRLWNGKLNKICFLLKYEKSRKLKVLLYAVKQKDLEELYFYNSPRSIFTFGHFRAGWLFYLFRGYLALPLNKYVLWNTPLHPQKGQIPHRPNRNQAHILRIWNRN